MHDGVTWSAVFPMAATLFGVLASALMGMAVARLNGIEKHLGEMNGKLFSHLTDPHIHDAGFAKTSEQITNLLQTVQVAHQRIDRIKEEA